MFDLKCVCLYFFGQKITLLLKKLIFMDLDNFLKIIIFLKKSVFNFFVETEKNRL